MLLGRLSWLNIFIVLEILQIALQIAGDLIEHRREVSADVRKRGVVVGWAAVVVTHVLEDLLSFVIGEAAEGIVVASNVRMNGNGLW